MNVGYAYAVLTLLALSIAAYFFFFLRRALKAWDVTCDKPLWLIGIAVVSLIIGILSVQITRISALVILHFMIFNLIVQGIYRLVCAIFKKKHINNRGIAKKIVATGFVPLLLTAALMLGGYLNLQYVRATEYTVYTAKSIRAEGYRVALLADLHFGVSIDDNALKEVCDEISQKGVDIVVLCGDIVDDGTSKTQVENVFDILGDIDSTYGVFYTYGNHDRPFRNMQGEYTADFLYETIVKNNIAVLQDDTFVINDELTLVGRDDKGFSAQSNRKSIFTLLSDVDRSNFILTLDHQPCEYAENGKAGTDLILSGHTHAGQLWPLNWLQELVPFNDGVYGYYDIDQDTAAIITSGVAGWGFEVKTAAPAEYVIVDILPKSEK